MAEVVAEIPETTVNMDVESVQNGDSKRARDEEEETTNGSVKKHKVDGEEEEKSVEEERLEEEIKKGLVDLGPNNQSIKVFQTKKKMTCPNHKKILCQLSMLERRMAQGTENQMQLVEDSIRHAKEAILLDVEDGNAWYNLGNAYLTSFFATGSRNHKQLLESLKAYQHAEKDEAMKSNPDLYFNSATVNKYLENYERALTGFQAAASKDPGLNATEEVQKMVTLLDNLANSSKVLRSVFGSKVKGKRTVSLTSSLSDMNLNTSLKKATVKQLLEGLNKDVVVLAKVLQFIKYDDVAPMIRSGFTAVGLINWFPQVGSQYDLQLQLF